ncbi:MAG TPA: hypothetical protein VMV92_45095 [Streptosporangiaceae bacterium]|nr:hypothetical protein [Streptosporangiaceae bacterium]
MAGGETPGQPIIVAMSPDGIAITPDGKTAYVANSGDNTVTPIRLPVSSTTDNP